MASPQRENGHIDIANEIADKLCSYKISGQEWQITWVVLRKTWGWLEDANDKNGPKKKMEAIPLAEFVGLTRMNRHRCHAIIKGLVSKHILIKRVIKKYNKPIITYGFQKNFDKWSVLQKSVTVIEKYNKVLQKTITTPIKEKKEIKDICPQQTILDLYHEILPDSIHHNKWLGHKKRMGKLNARWKDKIPSKTCPWHSGQIEYWENLFKYISKNDFLMGRTHPHWQGFSLDWLVTEDNFLKTTEGKYSNKPLHTGSHK